ncbi:unnamed protein product [Clonostachys solani]|uniref:GPI-anchored wall transfer protein n=1 Tax=Clonostachys solani TaxID=160281 RepID=A0A9N9ZJ75_9HYPO|nr:unnamed protein product [Clonostachys solani]
MSTYKQQKEDFVSNLTGGTVGEIVLVSVVGYLSVGLWSALQARQAFFQPYGPIALVVDYFLNVVVMLLAMTLYANSLVKLCLLLVAPMILILVLPPKRPSTRRRPRVPSNADPKGNSKQLNPLPLKPFLTVYRSFMMTMTCVAILAVDFPLFPRRFAKVETWGTSLMDIGVGSFVFTAGMVAARPVLKDRASGRQTGLVSRVMSSFRHSIPLLILGVIRMISVKGLDYAEHVSEYGIHWNFFFTLGLLPPFVAASQAALTIIPSYAALALLISGTYQLLLETTELKAFVLTAPRTNIISMNREGIFSFLGYLAIFLAGQDLGMFIIPRKLNPRSNATAGVQRNTLLLTLAVWFFVWSGLYLLSTGYSFGLGLGVSRRLANLPYVLWVASYNTGSVLAFCIIDSIFFPAFYNATDTRTETDAYLTATSRVLRAFNRNGLAIFLVANLLTGLVNMTVNTLEASPLKSVGILIAYTASISAFALLLDDWGISIKL